MNTRLEFVPAEWYTMTGLGEWINFPFGGCVRGYYGVEIHILSRHICFIYPGFQFKLYQPLYIKTVMPIQTNINVTESIPSDNFLSDHNHNSTKI